MVVRRNKNDTYSAFQRAPGTGRRKVGFVADGATMGEAMANCTALVAEHGAKTGEIIKVEMPI